jgi:small-conductance mechanosensitive channel
MLGKYSGIVYGILSIIVMATLFKLMTRSLRAYTRKHAFKEENERTFIRCWQYGYVFAATAICVTAFSGEFQALGITMAFIGSIMGWMLSAPIKNIAGWIFLIASKPLKVGDRVIFGDITGDVTDINMNFIVMDQVGGTTVGEDSSGRGVLVPMSWVFDRVVNNYSMELPSHEAEKKYLLDEVVVRITYDSDWDEAERILKESAMEVTADAISDTGGKPYIRAEFFPSGVFMRIRYKVSPTDRQRTWSEIVRRCSQKLDRSDKVFYSFNKSNVLVNLRGEIPSSLDHEI